MVTGSSVDWFLLDSQDWFVNITIREKIGVREKVYNGKGRAYESCRLLFAAGVGYGNEDSSVASYARYFPMLLIALPIVAYTC